VLFGLQQIEQKSWGQININFQSKGVGFICKSLIYNDILLTQKFHNPK